MIGHSFSVYFRCSFPACKPDDSFDRNLLSTFVVTTARHCFKCQWWARVCLSGKVCVSRSTDLGSIYSTIKKTRGRENLTKCQ